VYFEQVPVTKAIHLLLPVKKRPCQVWYVWKQLGLWRSCPPSPRFVGTFGIYEDIWFLLHNCKCVLQWVIRVLLMQLNDVLREIV